MKRIEEGCIADFEGESICKEKERRLRDCIICRRSIFRMSFLSNKKIPVGWRHGEDEELEAGVDPSFLPHLPHDHRLVSLMVVVKRLTLVFALMAF